MAHSFLSMQALSRKLETLYAQVPATCCAGSGECCRLTAAEYRDHFATMFPLYRAEYRYIVRFVKRTFSTARRQALFAAVEERPRRCPLMDEEQRCTIYPVRPLICRTYGVMNPTTIAQAVAGQQDQVPGDWLDRFARREGAMVCPRVQVREPEKLENHARNLIHFTYERELIRLSERVSVAGPVRQQLFSESTGRSAWPLRWSWGGFNALRFAPLDWMRRQFREYWEKAELVDAG